MGKLKPFFFGTLLGAGLSVCALQFHVVHSLEGVRVVPRTPQPSLGLAYVDVRDWDAETWSDRPELVRALIANGSTDLVATSVAQDVVDSTVDDSSTLGQLREFLNQNASASTEDAPEFPLLTPAAEGDDAFDDLFKLPFPQEARNESGTQSGETRSRIARRELPDINDVLGEDTSSMEQIDRSAYQRETSSARSEFAASAQDSGPTTDSSGRNQSRLSYGSSNRFSSDGSQSDSASNGLRYLSDHESSGRYSSDRSDRSTDRDKPSPVYEGFSAADNARDQDRSGITALESESSTGVFTEDSSSGYTRPSASGGSDSSRTGARSYSSAAEETEALEAMLFGSDAADGSRLDGDSPGASGSRWNSSDDAAGMFDEVTSQLEDRAESALQRAREGFGNEVRESLQDTVQSTGRYLRDRTEDRGYGAGSSADRSLPPALQALRDGFDPFVE